MLFLRGIERVTKGGDVAEQGGDGRVAGGLVAGVEQRQTEHCEPGEGAEDQGGAVEAEPGQAVSRVGRLCFNRSV